MSKGEANELFGGIDFNSLSNPDATIDLNSLNTESQEEEENNEEEESSEDDSLLIDINEDNDSEDNEPDSNEEDDNDDSSSSSPFYFLASVLHEKGLLSSFDVNKFKKAVEETGDETEALMTMINEEIDTRADFIENSLSPAQKEYLAALAKGIPDNVFAEAKALKKSYSEINIEEIADDLDSQAEIYRTYLEKSTKFSKEKIDKLVESKKANDELLDEVKEGLEFLKEIDSVMLQEAEEKAQAERERKANEAKLFMEQLQDKVVNTKEVIPGVKVPKTMQDLIYKNMTTAAGKDKAGNPVNNIALAREEDPIGFEIKLQYLFTATNGFKDFSKLVVPAKTAATNKLAEALERDSSWISKAAKGNIDKETKGAESIIRSLKL